MIRSVVCFFAHPDDESVLAGGLITLLTGRGVPVHVVSATRGEGGELGDPPVTHRGNIGNIRENELRCASRALGASVGMLGYVDPLIGADDLLSPFKADFDTLVKQISTLIKQRGADLVLTHGSDGEYGHPAHQLVHRAVLRAAQITPVRVYTVAANVPTINDRLWNESELAHFALDIRPWARAKVQAMECHVSQHALFMRRRKLKVVADALRTVESVRRALPPVAEGSLPDDDFAELLRASGAWTPDPLD